MERYSVKAGLIVIGEDLEIRRDTCIHIRDSVIESIESSATCTQGYLGGEHVIITPQPVNAHIHTADYAFPEYAIEESLEEAVAPPHGVKHKLLGSLSDEALEDAILSAIRESWRQGVGLLVDFREGGGRGCRIGKRALERAPEGIEVLFLGRPGPEWPSYCDGLGLSSTLDLELGELRTLATKYRPAMAHVAETRSSRESGDLERAVDVGLDAVVHGVYLSMEDLALLAERGIGLIVCPRSNMWHGLPLPPIAGALRVGVRLGIGTDNAGLVKPDPWREAEAALLAARIEGYRERVLAKHILSALFVEGYRVVGQDPRVIGEGREAYMLLFNGAYSGILNARDHYNALIKRLDSGLLVARIDRGEVAWL